MTLLTGLFVGLVVVPTTIWIALATHYHFRWPWLRWLVSLVPLVVVGASLALAAACALGTRRVVGVAGDHHRLVVFAAPQIGP